MGQSPTRPLEHHSNDLMHTPPLEELLHYSLLLQEAGAIDHLPDLSPFPRRYHGLGLGQLVPPPLPLSGRPGRGSRPPSYRSSVSARRIDTQQRSRGANPAAGVKGAVRQREAKVNTHKRATTLVVKRNRQAKKSRRTTRDDRRRPASSRDGDGQASSIPGQPGFDAVLPTDITLPTRMIVPRIELVESSPLLGSNGAHPSHPHTSTPLASASAFPIGQYAHTLPQPPNFARSPSMPAVLPDIVPEYLLLSPRPPLSRPSTAPEPGPGPTSPTSLAGGSATCGLLPPLPLPGTPLAEEAPLIDFADFKLAPYGSSQSQIQSLCTSQSFPREPSSASACAASVDRTGRTKEDGTQRIKDDDNDAESVVTQEIRILRVVNPDPDTEDPPEHQEQQQQRSVDGMLLASNGNVKAAGTITLAEKRQVSTPPRPIRTDYSLAAQDKDKDKDYLSLVPLSSGTTTSSSASSPQTGLFSKACSSSSPVSSVPPSPGSSKQKSRTKQAVAAASLGRECGALSQAVQAAVAGAAISTGKPQAVSSPATTLPTSTKRNSAKLEAHKRRSGNRARDPQAAATAAARSPRRGRSYSLSSSGDGDRSGTESSAAGCRPRSPLSPKLKRKQQQQQHLRLYASAGPGTAVGQKGQDRTAVERPDLLQVPPSLGSLFGVRTIAVGDADTPRSAAVPPASPRPPNTPRLAGIDGSALLSSSPPALRLARTAPAIPSLNVEVANATSHDVSGEGSASSVPLFLPPASPLKMDWFTTDLLLRCGIQPSSLTPLPASPTTAKGMPMLSPGPFEHPSALQPRRASSPLPLPPTATLSPSKPSRTTRDLHDSTSGFPSPGIPVKLNLLDEKDDPFLCASLLPTSAIAIRAVAGSQEAGVGSSSSPTESVFTRRERKKREKAARYAAFAALAQMAVESPQGNPFVGADGSGGAVRLGEYKRGFSGREIVRWARAVRKAEELEEMDRDVRDRVEVEVEVENRT